MYLQIQVKSRKIYLDESWHVIPARYRLSYRTVDKKWSSLDMIFNISSPVRTESCGVRQWSPFAKTKTQFKLHKAVIIAIFFFGCEEHLVWHKGRTQAEDVLV